MKSDINRTYIRTSGNETKQQIIKEKWSLSKDKRMSSIAFNELNGITIGT